MSNQKVRLWSAAKVVALVLALAVGQVISGVPVQPAYAGDYCPPPPGNGNNGWGNGGGDGTNNGSVNGVGVSGGGQGAGQSQSGTKSPDALR
jgi:hypothetical protein